MTAGEVRGATRAAIGGARDVARVAVLMATYNGERFLREQLDSILSQSFSDFDLYVSDDGSKDGTAAILKEYAKKDARVKLMGGKSAGGSAANFMKLLKKVAGKYELYMFSDQDDVWLAEKIERMVEKYDSVLDADKTPLLLHSDLLVVDKDLEMMAESFMKYSGLEKDADTFNRYLAQNNVTGCTMLINQALVARVDFKVQGMLMHDWYLALLASAFGKVLFVDVALIKYRQHGGNVLGAKNAKGLKRIFGKAFDKKGTQADLRKLFRQAEGFYEAHGAELAPAKLATLQEFLRIPKVSKFERIRIIRKNQFYKQGLIRVLGELVYI